MRDYQICSRCVMDTSDSQIQFDSNGVCDHCRDYDENIIPHWHTDERGDAAMEAIAAKIREDGKDREFDCILGMSGGLDSSYLLHLAVTRMKLRPLVFHVDGGWNTELAVHNIECIVDKLGLDLYTEVINWEDMRDFQLAFFKAGVAHLDIPQDMAFIAVLYEFAMREKIKYILNGGNFSTECVRNPKEWIYYGTDMAQLRDIRSKFCTRPLKHYPMSSVLRHKFYLRFIRGIEVVKPLNMMPYTRQHAIETLSETYGWQSYPQKHFESRFTKFYEGYWLPNRFGFDTRRVQYSSLILTGQMHRDDALEKLKHPPYDEEEALKDFEYVATKLQIPVPELQTYFDQPNRSYKDYKNSEWLFDFGAKAMKMMGLERSVKR